MSRVPQLRRLVFSMKKKMRRRSKTMRMRMMMKTMSD
jgi:hypothetical protein